MAHGREDVEVEVAALLEQLLDRLDRLNSWRTIHNIAAGGADKRQP
jgi:hypothetical protein